MPRRDKSHPSAEKVGQRIRELRQERGLTMEKLAYESEMDSKGHLSNIERGLVMPTVATLEKLAEGLETSVVDLVNAPGADPRAQLIELTRMMPAEGVERLLALALELMPARPSPKPRG